MKSYKLREDLAEKEDKKNLLSKEFNKELIARFANSEGTCFLNAVFHAIINSNMYHPVLYGEWSEEEQPLCHEMKKIFTSVENKEEFGISKMKKIARKVLNLVGIKKISGGNFLITYNLFVNKIIKESQTAYKNPVEIDSISPVSEEIVKKTFDLKERLHFGYGFSAVSGKKTENETNDEEWLGRMPWKTQEREVPRFFEIEGKPHELTQVTINVTYINNRFCLEDGGYIEKRRNGVFYLFSPPNKSGDSEKTRELLTKELSEEYPKAYKEFQEKCKFVRHPDGSISKYNSSGVRIRTYGKNVKGLVGGHSYTCLKLNGKWFEVNDDKVTETSPKNVMKLSRRFGEQFHYSPLKETVSSTQLTYDKDDSNLPTTIMHPTITKSKKDNTVKSRM
ncbi:MAG: hypothetical protein LBJ09_00530 [Clostridiales bacterium]|nr:hypothetical protein [Clostridiales bacterium]